MAEIYFQCPVCKQRIATGAEAAGVALDCPTCRSTLIVPAKSNEVPQVEVRRLLTVSGNSQAELYEEIEKARGLVLKEHERTLAARAEAEKLREELARAKAECAQAKKEAERAQVDVETRMAEVKKADSTAVDARTELERFKTESAQALKDAGNARLEAARLQENEKALKSAMEKLQGDLTAAIRDRDTVASRLGSLSSLQTEITDLKQENQAIAALRDEFQRQAEKAEASCVEVQGRLAASEKERTELKAHVALLQVQFEESVGFRRKCESLQQEAGNLGRQVQELGGERDALKLKIAQAEVETKELRAQLEAAKAEAVSQREVAIKAEVERVTAANAKELAEARELSSVLEKEKTALKEELEKVRKEMGALTAEYAALDIKRDELAKRLEERETTPVQKVEAAPAVGEEMRLAEIQSQLRIVTEERDRARTEVTAVNAGLERAKQHVSVLQARRDQMREEITRLKASLGLSPEVEG